MATDVHALSSPDPTGTLRTFQNKRVLVIGDLMLDTYLTGDAERISPEAPVPVVRIEHEAHLLGGAGNVACNIAALGGRATIIGIAGRDSAADTLDSLFTSRGIRAVLTRLDRRTTVKTRVMARRQQMLRLDHECTDALTPSELSLLLQVIRAEAADHDVLILSDYAKGLINAAFTDGLTALIASLPHQVTVLVDPKPQHFPLFSSAALLTPNLKETGEGAHLPVRSREEILTAGRSILHSVGCRHLLSTLGPQGMALFLSPSEVWHIPALALDVFDVTGAGDTVIATIGLALAAGCSLLDACIVANCAAGVVVGKVGAATVSPKELEASLSTAHRAIPSRWV